MTCRPGNSEGCRRKKTSGAAAWRMKLEMMRAIGEFGDWGSRDIYPLVNIQKAFENGHRNSGLTD